MDRKMTSIEIEVAGKIIYMFRSWNVPRVGEFVNWESKERVKVESVEWVYDKEDRFTDNLRAILVCKKSK